MRLFFSKYLILFLTLSFISISTNIFAEETIKAKYQIEDSNIVGSQIEFEYYPESLYEVNCQIGHITDIVLKPGEEIIYIGAGDTAQWMVDQAIVNNTSHVYIKPKVSEATTNLIINSNFHSYRLIIQSTDNFYPIVKWNFNQEEQKARASIYNKQLQDDGYFDKNGVLTQRPKKLNFNYSLTKKKQITNVFIPLSIYDDGLKTYIKMQPNNKYDLPVLYNVDKAENITLVNYRIKGNLFIVDKVFEHGRLMFTNKAYIDFKATKKKDEK